MASEERKPRRKATPEENERLRLGTVARHDAIKALIAKHSDEFEDLHAQKRLALGLSERSGQPRKSRAQLEEQIRKQEAKLEKWKRELQLVG